MGKRHKTRKRLTKIKRKKRALRRAASSFGFDGFYFYHRLWDIECSTTLDYKSRWLIRAPRTLKRILKSGKTYERPYRGVPKMKVRLIEEKMTFDSVEEFRKYLLIKELAGYNNEHFRRIESWYHQWNI